MSFFNYSESPDAPSSTPDAPSSTPDAPSSTPEPPATSQGLDLSPVNGNHQLAAELQQRLQSQTTRSGKPKLQRQSTVESEEEDDDIDGDYSGLAAQENTGWARNTGYVSLVCGGAFVHVCVCV